MAAPAASTSIDPYRVLKVDRDAAQEEISKSLRLLELRLHPDRNLDASDEQLAANKARRETVRKAYALIGTEAKRQEYDEKWAKAHPDKAASGQLLAGPALPASLGEGTAKAARPAVAVSSLVATIVLLLVPVWPVARVLVAHTGAPLACVLPLLSAAVLFLASTTPTAELSDRAVVVLAAGACASLFVRYVLGDDLDGMVWRSIAVEAPAYSEYGFGLFVVHLSAAGVRVMFTAFRHHQCFHETISAKLSAAQKARGAHGRGPGSAAALAVKGWRLLGRIEAGSFPWKFIISITKSSPNGRYATEIAPAQVAFIRWFQPFWRPRCAEESDQDLLKLHSDLFSSACETLCYSCLLPWLAILVLPLPRAGETTQGSQLPPLYVSFTAAFCATVAAAFAHRSLRRGSRPDVGLLKQFVSLLHSVLLDGACVLAAILVPLLPNGVGQAATPVFSLLGLALLWGCAPPKQEAMAMCGVCGCRPATHTCVHCDVVMCVGCRVRVHTRPANMRQAGKRAPARLTPWKHSADVTHGVDSRYLECRPCTPSRLVVRARVERVVAAVEDDADELEAEASPQAFLGDPAASHARCFPSDEAQRFADAVEFAQTSKIIQQNDDANALLLGAVKSSTRAVRSASALLATTVLGYLLLVFIAGKFEFLLNAISIAFAFYFVLPVALTLALAPLKPKALPLLLRIALTFAVAVAEAAAVPSIINAASFANTFAASVLHATFRQYWGVSGSLLLMAMMWLLAELLPPLATKLRGAVAWHAGSCWVGKSGRAKSDQLQPLLATNRSTAAGGGLGKRQGVRLPFGDDGAARIRVQVYEVLPYDEEASLLLERSLELLPGDGPFQSRLALLAPGHGEGVVVEQSLDGDAGGARVGAHQNYTLSKPDWWEVTIQPQATASRAADSTAIVQASSLRQRFVCSLWLRLSLTDCWRRNLRVRARQLQELPRLSVAGVCASLRSAAHAAVATPRAVGRTARFVVTSLSKLPSAAETPQEAAVKAVRKRQARAAAGGVVTGGGGEELKLLTGVAAGDVPSCTAIVDYAGEAFTGVGLGPPNQLQRPRVVELASPAERRDEELHPGWAKLKVACSPPRRLSAAAACSATPATAAAAAAASAAAACVQEAAERLPRGCREVPHLCLWAVR